jgi:hypothetical protein
LDTKLTKARLPVPLCGDPVPKASKPPMKADRFARQKRAKIALGVLAVGLLTAGVLTVILVMMGRKHPGF